MTIKTKLNIGDHIYFIHEKIVICSIVRKIKVEVFEASIIIFYICNREECSQIGIKVDEEFAFKTKTELLKSL